MWRQITRRWAVPVVAAVSLLAGATGCTEAPVAQPAGVRWLRDTGGVTDPVTGGYTGDWQAYVTRAGATTGPTADPDAYQEATLGWLGFAYPQPLNLPPLLPDGTAKFPHSGFAGEGVTVALVADTWVATFPSGSCDLFQTGVFAPRPVAAYPSPDGRLLAVWTFDNSGVGPGSTRTEFHIRSLEDGGGCPTVTGFGLWGGDPQTYQPATGAVWAPDSSALIYGANRQPDGSVAMARLDATPGSSPTYVLGTVEGCSVPLGWSIENRLLANCATGITSFPLGAGITHVIDTFVPDPATPLEANRSLFLYRAHYLPGTNVIVFTKAVPVTNTDGFVVPWLQVHTVLDLPLATSSPISGSAPPLGWHEEPITDVFGTVTGSVEVPNQEFIDRFVR